MVVTVLLDTHVVLWAVFEPARLSPRVRLLLLDRSTTILLSAASAWEIATKVRLGRLEHARSIVDQFPHVLSSLVARELLITSKHCFVAGSYDIAHRDPFDRMLAAQAQSEDVLLISTDRQFDSFPVSVIW